MSKARPPHESQPCLRDLVDETDHTGKVPCELGRFCITAQQYPDHIYLQCAVPTCHAYAAHNDDDLYSASFYRGNKPCARAEAEQPDSLTRQQDRYSCLSTATAYALNTKFGLSYTERDIDKLLGRPPEEVVSIHGMAELDLALLRRGFSLEVLYPKDRLRLEDYYTEGSTLTLDDFKEAALAECNWRSRREFFAAYSEDDYVSDVANWRSEAERFKPYEETGQLTYTYTDITPELLRSKLPGSAIRAITSRFNGTTDIYHAVILEDIYRATSGQIRAMYFDPRFHSPSRITTKRGARMESMFVLGSGLQVMRKHV